MINALAGLLRLLSPALDETPAPETLPLIAVANGAIWVGLFLVLLWLLARGSRRASERLAELEEKSAPGPK